MKRCIVGLIFGGRKVSLTVTFSIGSVVICVKIGDINMIVDITILTYHRKQDPLMLVLPSDFKFGFERPN